MATNGGRRATARRPTVVQPSKAEAAELAAKGQRKLSLVVTKNPALDFKKGDRRMTQVQIDAQHKRDAMENEKRVKDVTENTAKGTLEMGSPDILAVRDAMDKVRRKDFLEEGDGADVEQTVMDNFVNKYTLLYADEDVRGDKDVMLYAISRDPTSIGFADGDLREDFDVVMAAMRLDGNGLLHVYPSLKANKDVVLTAVRNNGKALYHVPDGPDDLRNDREVCLAAVSNYGRALRYVPEALRQDREIATAAVKQDPAALAYLAVETEEQKDFKRELEDLLERVWGLPETGVGKIHGERVTYRDCRGVWRTPGEPQGEKAEDDGLSDAPSDD